MAKLVFSLIALMATIASALGQSCGSSPNMRPNLRHLDDQRIVGGVEARPGSHPWIVSLGNGNSHFCGGTLIRTSNSDSAEYVITAAHCVYDGWAGMSVTAGAHDLYRPTASQQTVRAAKVVYHPQYNPTTTLNDIAVVKLERAIKFSSAIQPACLPASGEQVSDNADGTVAGWGLTREGGYDTSSILLQVGVPTINSRQCDQSYRSQGIAIDPSAMLCAGYRQGGKDACQGDSGGPYVIKNGSNYVLQGVVSFGVGCARPGMPGVYARVSNYIRWINQVIGQMG
jgi:transmembrane serine protease 3